MYICDPISRNIAGIDIGNHIINDYRYRHRSEDSKQIKNICKKDFRTSFDFHNYFNSGNGIASRMSEAPLLSFFIFKVNINRNNKDYFGKITLFWLPYFYYFNRDSSRIWITLLNYLIF